MSLIDADELLDTLGAIHNKIGADFDYKRIMQEIRQRARHNNVKAIPIEWILNYRKNNQGEITYYTIDAIDHMLCEWCKRNNIDMWNMIDSWEKENADKT